MLRQIPTRHSLRPSRHSGRITAADPGRRLNVWLPAYVRRSTKTTEAQAAPSPTVVALEICETPAGQPSSTYKAGGRPRFRYNKTLD